MSISSITVKEPCEDGADVEVVDEVVTPTIYIVPVPVIGVASPVAAFTNPSPGVILFTVPEYVLAKSYAALTAAGVAAYEFEVLPVELLNCTIPALDVEAVLIEPFIVTLVPDLLNSRFNGAEIVPVVIVLIPFKSDKVCGVCDNVIVRVYELVICPC